MSTGEQIEFGNFCLIPKSKLQTLVNIPMIWNNLAATLVRSRLPLVLVTTDRGSRYSGSSKMNFVSLVMHGLSAMAVYSDVVMVRLLLGTLILGLVTFLGIIVAVAIRLFTSLAITSVVGLLSVIFLQAIILITISAFTILNTRSMKGIVPRFDASSFVRLFNSKLRHCERSEDTCVCPRSIAILWNRQKLVGWILIAVAVAYIAWFQRALNTKENTKVYTMSIRSGLKKDQVSPMMEPR
jgi:hypothetical protein